MDTTKQEFFEKLFLALKNINQLIIREDDQNSLFEKMCENLIKDLGFSIVVVGEIDNTNHLKIIHKKRENSQLFDDIPISINGKSEYGKGTAYLAYKTNTVIINQNTLTTPYQK
ncbi:MAG: hypothetical protein ACP5PO_04505 [Desulfurella sp.]|uniref:hypothetical protein n=1 Tax=Desulfurella sp. TaxID=1962857 RepID=UPI003D0D0A1A